MTNLTPVNNTKIISKSEKLGIIAAELENDIYVANATHQSHISISLHTARRFLNAVRLLQKINGYDLLLKQ